MSQLLNATAVYESEMRTRAVAFLLKIRVLAFDYLGFRYRFFRRRQKVQLYKMGNYVIVSGEVTATIRIAP